MTANQQQSTELYVQLMALWHFQAGIYYAIHAEDMWMTGGTPDATQNTTKCRLQMHLQRIILWSDLTLEVEVVTITDNTMTPIPRHNSDDSSQDHSAATESE
jgi:hypothetical protein